ncbi:MAG: DUF72 domain-containing protein [Chloroflexi bacterium]|nr:DUF72 domain-containing protein [Chloroflexota bacterium]
MIRVGTSGWLYQHWKGPFYPPGLSQPDMLAYYASHTQDGARLCSVEVNSTFYGLPAPETVIGWRDAAPAGFLFAVKASRYITHMKHLIDPQEPLARMFDRIDLLGDKLGPVLFQLPGQWKRNVERLRSFLNTLPADHQYAFEFRNTTWFDPQVYAALAERRVGFCIYEFGDTLSPRQVTGDLVYVRLHGPEGPYQGSYTTQALAQWANDLCAWEQAGLAAYCYFDNDQAGYAIANALELQALINAQRARSTACSSARAVPLASDHTPQRR